jgi:hypothetical protein
MDGRKETRDQAAELGRLLERLSDLSMTLPEAASIRSRIFDLLGRPGPDEDASGASRSGRGPPRGKDAKGRSGRMLATPNVPFGWPHRKP